MSKRLILSHEAFLGVGGFMWRANAIVLITLFFLISLGSVLALDMYRWTDENGELHVATSLEDVPEKYRDQITKMTAGPATKVAPSPEQPQPEVEESDSTRFEIPYVNEGSTQRVIIPVKFNDRVIAPMALDTGSPGMVISVELAAKLGVFSRDNGTLLTEASGIGGSTAAILTIIDSISVESARDVFVPTTITAGMSNEFDGLVGMNLLANYTVSIDSQKKVVVFEKMPPHSGLRAGHDEDWWRRTFSRFRGARDFWRERAKSAGERFGSRSTTFVDFQARESERLLIRLDLHASK